jgi:hypothetical protein
VQVSSTLRTFNLIEAGEHQRIAAIAATRAAAAREEKARLLEQAWDEEASRWFAKAGLEAEAVSAQVRFARSLTAEAEDRRQGRGGSPASAVTFVEDALKVLGKIPHAHRRENEVEAMVASLRQQLPLDRQVVLGEMVAIQTEPIDLADHIAGARMRVAGLPPLEALIALGSIQGVHSVDNARERAREAARAFPLTNLLGGETLSSTGRKVAVRRGGLEDMNAQVGQKGSAIWHAMIGEHGFFVRIAVQARILPAIEAVTMQHRFTLEFLYDLCHRNAWIPAGHDLASARGLLHGLNQDFASAAALLVPQIENYVRYHLQRAGAHTLT